MRNMAILILISWLVAGSIADTFRNIETGEVFYGFQTQKRSGGRLLVYNSDENKMQAIEASEYEITLDSNGRRDSVVRIPIRQSEILLSKVLSDRVARLIVDASNSGPQFVLIEIDSPGGRGEYMRTIADVIEQATHCPIVAYIPGGEFGGAYSAAAVIALACDAIYMAPTATIGAVGSMTGATTHEQYAAFLNLYSADTLAGYSGYVMGLVPREDLRLIARALVDKSVSVVEVRDAVDNQTKFVERDNRQPTQTVVRTLAEGIPANMYRLPTGEAAQGPRPAEILGRVLTLSATEAVRIGLADGIVASQKEIAAARNVPEARFTNAPDIAPTIRQFTAARRNIGQSLFTIERFENHAATLEDQIARVEDQLRTGTVTREVGVSSMRRRGQVDLPGMYGQYYGFDTNETTIVRNRLGGTEQGVRTRRPSAQSERYITEQPNVSLEMLRMEQVAVLRDLTSEYRRVINMARRWPGALPPELPIEVLERNRDSAVSLLDAILRYPVQTFPQPQPAPVQRGTRR